MEVSLGVDLGAHNSKLTIACPSSTDKDRLVVHRVPRPDMTQGAGVFEFPARVALEGDHELLTGVLATQKEHSCPLKVAFMYCAGIRGSKAFAILPESGKLLSAIDSKTITSHQLYQAVTEHFECLRDAAAASAKRDHRRITTIVVTFPNFLCEDEEADYFILYLTFYDELITRIWPSIRRRYAIMEGQASGIHVTADFDDPLWDKDDDARAAFFEGLRIRGFLQMLVVDGGSSSQNFDVQSVFFEDGRRSKSQSCFSQGWVTGTRGGSHNANEAVYEHIRKELAPLIQAREIVEGDIVAFLQDFERQKDKIDYEAYIRDRRHLTLHCSGATNVILDTDGIRNVFDSAFEAGIQALLREVGQLLELGRDFFILFTGGSYCNPGLCNKVKKEIDNLAAPYTGIKVKYAFLKDQEKYPTSGNSIGAALSSFNLPAPVDVLRGSAIGIQRTWEQSTDEFTGEDGAGFLFCMGSGSPVPFEDDLRLYPAEEKKRMSYKLVCQPKYRYRGRRRPQLRIGRPKDVLADPNVSTYELCWSIGADEIPNGLVRFSISGAQIDRLSRGLDERPDMTAISFVLTCVKINAAGRHTPHDKDKKWFGLLRIDPATHFLVVHDCKVLPAWCTKCKTELAGHIYSCEDCGWDLCWTCHLAKRHHDQNHEVVHVDLDGERDGYDTLF